WTGSDRRRRARCTVPATTIPCGGAGASRVSRLPSSCDRFPRAPRTPVAPERTRPAAAQAELNRASSERHPGPQLELTWRRCLLIQTKRRQRVLWIAARAEDIVHLDEVRAIEHVEGLEDEADANPRTHVDVSRNPDVNGRLTGQPSEVATDARRRIARNTPRAV